MRFILNRRKAAQAAAYIVKQHDGRMNLMVLLKLFDIKQDRESLIDRGTQSPAIKWCRCLTVQF